MIPRQQLIQQAARAEWSAVWPGIAYDDGQAAGATEGFEDGSAAALPVIVRAVTDEIRTLHQPRDEKLWPNDCIDGYCDHPGRDEGEPEGCCPPMMDQVCAHCYEMGDHPDDGWEHYFSESIKWPCPTVRALDAIDAEYGVTR